MRGWERDRVEFKRKYGPFLLTSCFSYHPVLFHLLGVYLPWVSGSSVGKSGSLHVPLSGGSLTTRWHRVPREVYFWKS